MPIYQYQNLRTGRLEERRLPVERRDCVPPHLRRVTVPRRVGYVGGLREPNTADATVPKAFRELELSGKSAGQIERETGFTREHIRRVWDF